MAKDAEVRLSINGIALDSSLKDLGKLARELKKEITDLTPGTEAFVNKSKELGVVKGRIADIRQEIRGYSGEVTKASALMQGLGNIAKQAGAYVLGMFAIGSIQNFIQYLGQAIGLAGKISDKFADIQKTTGMTAKEVRGFADALQQLDTRTSLGDLLDIAKIGGQIGIAKKELLGFVESVDKAVVALGDEFTGGAEQVAKELGILKGLFKETKGLEAGKALNDIGSAINALGASGSATGPVIAEFTKRLGALPGSIAPSIQNTLGLGAAFEEMGLTAEISSGGLTNVFLTMGEKSALFAQQLGISKAEFDKMFNQDSNATVLKVAESFKGLSDTQLIETMKRLGIGTQESIKVMGVLSNSTDIVRQRQALANTEMAKGTSLTDEFNIKNNTLAADMEKGRKALDAFALVLGNIASFFLGGLLSGFVRFLELQKLIPDNTKKAADGVIAEKIALNALVEAIKDTNTSDQARLKLVEQLNAEYPEFTKKTGKLTDETGKLVVNEQALQVALDETNKAFDRRILTLSKQEIEQKYLQNLSKSIQTEVELQKQIQEMRQKGTDKGRILLDAEADTYAETYNTNPIKKQIKAEKKRREALLKERENTLSALKNLAKEQGFDSLDEPAKATPTGAKELTAQEKENIARNERLNAINSQKKDDKEAKDALLRAQQEYEDLKNAVIENQYDREIAQIETETKRKIAEVQKNGALMNEQKDLIGKQETLLELQKTQRIAEINRKRIDDKAKADEEELKRTVEQATAFVQEETNAVLVANEEAYLLKTEQANRLFEEGKIREDERLALIEEARFEREQADLEAEAMRLRALIALKTMIGQEETTEAQRLANQLLAIEQKKNDDSLKHQKETNQKKKEDDKKLLEAKQAIQDAELGLAKDFFGLVEAIAGKNKEVQRGLLAVNALVAIAEVNMNLQRSLMAIQAVHGWNPVTNATLSTIAKVRAGIAVGTIIAQTAAKFKDGGLISGPSHAQGGIRGTGRFANVEVEGGEFINNKISTANNLPALRMINAHPNTIFDVVPRTRFQGGGQLGGSAGLPTNLPAQAQNDMAFLSQKLDMVIMELQQNRVAIQQIKLTMPLLDLQKELNDLEERQTETTSRG